MNGKKVGSGPEGNDFLQIVRYRFHWRISKALKLPPYASSTLRGVFGHALRDQSCLTQAEDCCGCPVLGNCPYPLVFEPQRLPRPKNGPNGMFALSTYAIETPFTSVWKCYKTGEYYHFDMVLMTPQTIKQLPLITSAWRRAFLNGVGSNKGKAELIRVEKVDSEVNGVEISVPQFSQPENVTLRFQSPLRLEQKEILVKPQDLTPGVFLRHLIRRVSFLMAMQQVDSIEQVGIRRLNAMADLVQEGARQLRWEDWQRYSNRQRKAMKFGGIVGEWKLLQVPADLLPFIYLGQWIHVGKESSFGLGKYQWI